jgi:hypothetical protein
MDSYIYTNRALKQISPVYTDKQFEKYIKCQPLVVICTKIAVSIICKQKKNMKIRYFKFVNSIRVCVTQQALV